MKKYGGKKYGWEDDMRFRKGWDRHDRWHHGEKKGRFPAAGRYRWYQWNPHLGPETDKELRKLHLISHYARPLIVLFYIVVLYFLFSWGGFKALVILLALMLVAKAVFHVYYFDRLEKHVFEPVAALEQGFRDIANGNYQVRLASTTTTNQFDRLIRSFNEMAEKLRVSEQTNQAYEQNRKDLIANISHDLKTPLTSVQGYVEMILNGDVTEPGQVSRYLKIIQNNNAYINKLIDDLFLFSKLDMDKVEMQREPVKVKAFMQDLIGEFALELAEMQAELHYTDQLEQEEVIDIDGKRVCQAVRNVIGNAVRYGPDQGLRLEARLYAQEDYICLDLQDNGPGIAADKLDSIFERFYRIDTERGKDFNSTGLGLAIARELMEAQQGRITVASTEHAGSCFTLWFLRQRQCPGEDA